MILLKGNLQLLVQLFENPNVRNNWITKKEKKGVKGRKSGSKCLFGMSSMQLYIRKKRLSSFSKINKMFIFYCGL